MGMGGRVGGWVESRDGESLVGLFLFSFSFSSHKANICPQKRVGREKQISTPLLVLWLTR